MRVICNCLLIILLLSIGYANAQNDSLRHSLINGELTYKRENVYLGDSLIKKKDGLNTLFSINRPSHASFQFYLVYNGFADVFATLAIGGLVAGLSQVIFSKSTNAGVYFAASVACIGLTISFAAFANISLRHAVKHYNSARYK